MTGTETGLTDSITYVGLYVHKAAVCVALGESDRDGGVYAKGDAG
jgi:hypothetical protein